MLARAPPPILQAALAFPQAHPAWPVLAADAATAARGCLPAAAAARAYPADALLKLLGRLASLATVVDYRRQNLPPATAAAAVVAGRRVQEQLRALLDDVAGTGHSSASASSSHAPTIVSAPVRLRALWLLAHRLKVECLSLSWFFSGPPSLPPYLPATGEAARFCGPF